VSLVLNPRLETLRLRAAMLAQTRAFFAEKRVLEVETPALSPAGVPELEIESIPAGVRSLGPAPQYLHTSPEYAMKRLLAAGSGDIYQICRVFRDEELGRWHEPEFTLLEWYRVGWDDTALAVEVEALLERLLKPRVPLKPSTRSTYRQAFVDHLQVDPAFEAHLLAGKLIALGIDVPTGLDDDALLDLALSAVIVPRFDPDALTFLTDYPVSQAALARIKPGPPPAAARFEVFAGGLELANGFAELTDPEEQRRRFEAQLAARRRLGRPAAPMDEDFLRALTGLPDCAGVAVGFDRVVALATGASRLREALALAHEADAGF
jgi:lysyl-tRNA synthetase class 2